MPTIHIPDDVFADYLVANEMDSKAAKKQMQQAVKDNAPKQDP